MPDISDSLRQFLLEQSVLTLSLTDTQGCWTAPVLYSVDFSATPFTLNFLSSENSRHIQALQSINQMAAAIYADYQGRWQSICGVQMTGHLCIVEATDLKRSHAAYFSRFPEIKMLIDSPADEQEQRIGAAFAKSHFYRFSPTFVRFINNSDRFAGRSEWRF